MTPSFIYETFFERTNRRLKKIKTTFQCMDCDTTISSLRQAIDHTDDSVTPKESDIMGNLDNAIETLETHPD